MVYHKKKTRKVMNDWEQKFMPKLKKIHGTHSKNVFHRLMKKSSTLKATLKRRSKEYEVECNISLKEIREEMFRAYGKPCKYCKGPVVINNMVCDHVIPISLGGSSSLTNLQLICNRCNRRKGPLTDRQFGRLLVFLHRQSSIMADYVLRKLSRADVMA